MSTLKLNPDKVVSPVLCREFTIPEIRFGLRDDVNRCLIREKTVTIILNGIEMIYLMCLPMDLEYLTLGFLYTEGILESREDVVDIQVDERSLSVSVNTVNPEKLAGAVFMKRTVTSGCGKGVIFRNVSNAQRPRISSDFSISFAELQSLWDEIDRRDTLYRKTRGVHGSALCSSSEVIYFNPDIGRHNTIDRIAGKCFLEFIPVENKFLVCSGRFSSEMVLKLGAMGIPLAISRSVPTDLAVELAEDMGITLASTRVMRNLTIFSHPERVTN